MAQQKKNNRSKPSPKYSAGTLELRFVIGLILVALGVLVFLAAGLQLKGSAFDSIRALFCGLCGGLTVLFPIIPIWGGVLMILSTQKKTSPRELLLVSGLYLGLAACLTLVMHTAYNGQNMSLMDYLLNLNATKYNPADSYQLFLSRGWELGRKGTGGGGLGMLLAWPIWKTVGIVPGVILLVLLCIGDGLLLFRVDVKKLFGQVQQKAKARDQQKQQEQDALRQQELLWQQQQAAEAQQRMQTAQQMPVYNDNPPPVDQWGAQPQPAAPVWQSQQVYMPQQAAAPYQTTEQNGFQPTQGEQYVPVTSADMIYEQADYTQALQQEQNTNKAGKLGGIFGRRGEKQGKVQHSATGETWQNPDAPRRASFPPEQPVQQTQPTWQGNTQPMQPVQQPQPRQNNAQPVRQPQSAYQPARPSRTAGTENNTRQDAWQAPNNYAAPSWRDDGATTIRQATGRYHAVPTAPAEAEANEETPITRKLHQMQQTHEIEPEQSHAPHRRTPVNTQLRMEQVPPQATADDDMPPWEERPTRRQQAAQQERVPVPHLQTEPPKDAWKPELKLPPRRTDLPEDEEEKPEELPYVYPNFALIKMPEPASSETAEEDALRSRRLEETLQSFKVPAKVKHVTHGPAISRFELEIASGIRVNKITDLDRNIAMNMEVKSVRIEAPIPGKSLVGVEVPNHRVSKVTLREVLDTPAMQAAKSPLCVALGKDIAGTPIICDLAKMPHLLIAGATGSGKSVCVNAMINSILFRASPKEVRMILVDPKVVELQCYNNIPHLLIPVVSDPHKAAGALEWAVAEMMERYNKFKEKGVREITGYNNKLEDGEEYMPSIVIIIDELADLMMTCRKDVEERICRLAQLARAAGIHLVVATQRPSVDVITGLIKANIPSRIAFKVSSYVDSRTILDRPGAEKLLGYGDMLYLPNGEFTPIRVQGCFLTDEEVNNITDFIRRANPSEYDPNVIEQLESMQSANNGDLAVDEITSAEDDSNSDANLLQQAIEMTVQDGQTSTSMLQRRLRIGYARAGRLVDEMEKRGVVSQKDGAKPRMCLISREEFELLKQDGSLEE
ncbi:MAG: DNA translocase FtsK [Clostridia bacterium]|nr:DNA translocase FtsK [Clostridia bacterium]